MAATTYFDHVIDPATGQSIEVCDKYAREQLVHKVEKTIVNSLPAKPTTYDAWLQMEPFLYYVPISGQPNEYQVWTLFFVGDPTVPADYTDTTKYEWAQVADTDVDLSNFSTKGHTHEVIPEVDVEDHDYTPQGTVNSSFTGAQSTTDSKTHSHTITPSGSVSSEFSGNSGTTGSGTTGISLNKSSKKLSTKKMNIAPATQVNFQGSTTNAQRATGALEALSTYDADKAVMNGISVQDGVLSFVTKKMTTADTVSGLAGSVDASKVTFDGNGTVSNQDIATGAVESGSDLLGNDTGINDTGHTHSFTPSGSVSSSFSGTQGTTSEDTHSHQYTPNGNVSSSFSGLRANLKHKVDSKKVRTAPDEYDPSGNVFDWYGIEFDETEANPVKTRIGSLNMHRMLPIQSKMRRCLLKDDGTVNYYLDDRDSTKRAGSQEGWVESQETFVNKIETSELRDETETIEKIEGKSFAWNQLLRDANFDSTSVWFGGSGSLSFDNTKHTATIYSDTEVDNTDIKQVLDSALVPGHKYYFYAKATSRREGTVTITYYGGGSYPTTGLGNISANETKEFRVIVPWGSNNYKTIGFSIRGSGADYTVYGGIKLIDLTLIFGAGNEPTTVTQFESWLLTNKGSLGPFPYTAGELINFGCKMVKWNQLVGASTTSVSTTSGHKYYTVISGTKSVVTSAGSAIAVTGGTDLVFDLTKMFGAGLEPTLEECERIFVKDYYEYNAGTQKNLIDESGCGVGWKIVGFNKWDETWANCWWDETANGIRKNDNSALGSNGYIPIIGGKTYYVKTPISGAGYINLQYYDANKNYISHLGIYGGNGTFETPINANYVTFYTFNLNTYSDGICINISDPSRNGEYEPYNAHYYSQNVAKYTGVNSVTGERELIAPNGFKGVNNVLDLLYRENGATKFKKMIGYTNGSDFTSCGYDSTYHRFILTYNNSEPSLQFNQSTGIRAISNKYLQGESGYGVQGFKNLNFEGSIHYENGAILYVVDESYESSVEDFKSQLSNVNFVYILKTPITYTDIQDENGSPVILPIEMEVEHNGTISLLPEVTTTQLTAAPTLTMKKYVLTQGANLDGSDGQVMVEIPEHWRKVYRYTGSNSHDWLRAMISPYPQDGEGWIHVKKGYVSAYEAAIIAGKLSSVSNIVNLTLSVVNGKINATCDVSTASSQSDITSQLPTTYQTMDTFRTAARARGNEGEFKWNENVYEQNIAWIWLYWIEYANLNSQADFISALDANGYHQGGLGAGVTTISSGNWSSFNGYKPFVPCGITNCLGNQTGEVYLAVPSGLGGGTVRVNSYRGIEMPFGHIWKFADGIKYLGDGTQQAVLRCDNPANYSSAAASTNYTSIGNNYGGNGWKTKIMIGSDGDINCAAVGGSSNQAYCDYNYQAHASGTYYCCFLGGSANDSSSAGLVCVRSYDGVALSYSHVGSRLCFFEK